VLVRRAEDGAALVTLVALRGSPTVAAREEEVGEGTSSLVLDTEDPAYATDPLPIEVGRSSPPSARFARPGAVILLVRPSGRS
jgi:hypothetical protein